MNKKLKKVKNSLLVNCNKCSNLHVPVYNITSPNVEHKIYVCRDCALKIMEKYYDRRPDEIKETD